MNLTACSIPCCLPTIRKSRGWRGRCGVNTFLLLACSVLSLVPEITCALDSTWLANPVDNAWNNPANWSNGVPVGGANFAQSTITDIIIPQDISIIGILFEPEADSFTLTAAPGVEVTIAQNGTLNNGSGLDQTFISSGTGQNGGGFSFGEGSIIFRPVTFIQGPGDTPMGGVGYLSFEGSFVVTGPGASTVHNLGGTVPGGAGGQVNFTHRGASAEAATIINDGSTVAGAGGGETFFDFDKPTASNATLIANSGTNGGGGGGIHFNDDSLGGTAHLQVFGNGFMDMSLHKGPSLSIGSIEGDGQIYLGRKTLIVGTDSLSTTFSGVLHPGGPDGGSGSGSLMKIGTGTLTLTGANLYTNGTTVTEGTLRVSNTTGSGSGTGALSVNAGTIGGSGIIAGAVTVGTGNGTGAFLTPGTGTNKQVTLTIQSALTFNSDATYSYTFKGNRKRVSPDLVRANGVTINGGTIAISSNSQNRISRGIVLTVLSNTSASPISGTFSNLPDGAVVNVNGNNLQASYSGGDGNDLTLTVVP